MQQLCGLDASSLYLETPTAPMHVSGNYIYDPSTAHGGKVRFKQIIEYYVARAHLARCLRQTVVTVPLGLDHPWWLKTRASIRSFIFAIRHYQGPVTGGNFAYRLRACMPGHWIVPIPCGNRM